MERPPWLKVVLAHGPVYERVKEVIRRYRLHTVCQSAICPNLSECWGSGTATIMILGDLCTRGCRFCAVTHGNPHGKVDFTEPERVSMAVSELGLSYVVLTSVCRDDLPDGGAVIFAETVRAVKRCNPSVIVETLIPDFGGDRAAIAEVVEAGPDVVGHNVETVRRLTPIVRDRRASYDRSLDVLRTVKEVNPQTVTKSSVMLGLGETEGELLETLKDLREVGVDVVTLGQYLRPLNSPLYLPVAEYLSPQRFKELERIAYEFGFLYVAAGPFVRSSYRAVEAFVASKVRGVA
ncbi:MAG: lipoyl synthase [Thaumarchaeota archaeon]|nr:lipoyl synthase [Candidatus Calditenuaceae archaeon]MDW8186577.1 lipoyl synthase [Nitrososphaerota archaeon]